MRWSLAAVALVVAVNAFVVVSVARERRDPVSRTTIAVCARHVVGGGDSEEPPALLLRTVRDSASVPTGLDSAGLRALGFSPAVTAAVGRERDHEFRWPRARPAWVRLRSQGDSLGRFTVVAAAPRRESLPPDSTSLVVRGRISLLQHRTGPPPGAVGGGPIIWGAYFPAVVEVIPFALHLDRALSEQLRRTVGYGSGCGASAHVTIAAGARGGIWVEAVP